MSVYSARIRAARAYADITQLQLADALGVDEQTIKRRESPNGNEPKKGERIAIATICGVPPEFLEHGWGALTAPLTLNDGQIRLLAELLPQAVDLGQALRREREANEERDRERDRKRQGEAGGGA